MRHLRCFQTIVVTLAVYLGLCACTMGAASYGPLHEAARDGNVALVRTWIREKRNLDEKFNDTSSSFESNYSRVRGLTPLMVAAQAGQFEVAMLLLDGGANIYAESSWANGSNRLNVFDYAVEGGQHAVAELIWQRSDKIRFAKALDHQFANACIRFCDEKTGTNESTSLVLFLAEIIKDESTLGHGIGLVGCGPNSLPRLKFLAVHGVRFPRNTLHCIAGMDSSYLSTVQRQAVMDVAQFLIGQGADPNALPYHASGFTPLMAAASRHDPDMLKFLLAHGADPNKENSEGRTAIMSAVGSCSHAPPGPALERDQRQLVVIELLAGAGAHASMGPKVPLLVKCCAQKPLSQTQARICSIFGKKSDY